MSNNVKDIDMKSCTYHINNMINIKNFDPNDIKIDQKSYKNTFIYYNEYVTIKDLKYVQIKSVNPSYLIFSNLNGYFEEINKSKYLTLAPFNASKEKIKKYEELWSKIRDLIMPIT